MILRKPGVDVLASGIQKWIGMAESCQSSGGENKRSPHAGE